VAMHDGTQLLYFLTDHLGSVVAITDVSGTLLDEQRYMPFGEVRSDVGTITQTDFGYTFQRDLPELGLMDYKARFYDAEIEKFVQPDMVVPYFGYPPAFNRYAYSNNNPIYYTDPSGHMGIPPDVVTIDTGPSSPIEPIIISRSDWGALAPGASVTMLQNPQYDEGLWSLANDGGYMSYSAALPDSTLPEVLNSVVVHYEGDTSVMDNGYSGAGAVRKLQQQAMENGLYDIQYHYIVDPNGNIYEGRNIGARGTHVSPEVGNTGKIGILWLGVSLSRGDQPTINQFMSTVTLVIWLDYTYGIDNVGGHREYEQNVNSYTECPGDKAIPSVNRLKKLLPE
jgi:RHS repeat-associated protein